MPVLWPCGDHAVAMLWPCCGHAVAMMWPCCAGFSGARKHPECAPLGRGLHRRTADRGDLRAGQPNRGRQRQPVGADPGRAAESPMPHLISLLDDIHDSSNDLTARCPPPRCRGGWDRVSMSAGWSPMSRLATYQATRHARTMQPGMLAPRSCPPVSPRTNQFVTDSTPGLRGRVHHRPRKSDRVVLRRVG